MQEIRNRLSYLFIMQHNICVKDLALILNITEIPETRKPNTKALALITRHQIGNEDVLHVNLHHCKLPSHHMEQYSR